MAPDRRHRNPGPVRHGNGKRFGQRRPAASARTTAEARLDRLSDWEFAREPDALTGYDELVVLAARSEHPAGF